MLKLLLPAPFSPAVLILNPLSIGYISGEALMQEALMQKGE
jgi:hypothetical protein